MHLPRIPTCNSPTAGVKATPRDERRAGTRRMAPNLMNAEPIPFDGSHLTGTEVRPRER